MKNSKIAYKYITSEGALKLKEELTFLWSTERPKIVDAVSEAAKNGDRSENGDYLYGKRKLREIDRRLKYITNQLSVVKVVKDKPTNTDRIYFSAFVEKTDQPILVRSFCRGNRPAYFGCTAFVAKTDQQILFFSFCREN